MYVMYIDAHSITNAKGNKDNVEHGGIRVGVEFTDDDFDRIRDLEATPNLFKVIVG